MNCLDHSISPWISQEIAPFQRGTGIQPDELLFKRKDTALWTEQTESQQTKKRGVERVHKSEDLARLESWSWFMQLAYHVLKN
jgi:hypothetical protein